MTASFSFSLCSLPPSVNHQYAPALRKRADGSTYVGKRLTDDASAWREAAVLIIRTEAARQAFRVTNRTRGWTLDATFGMVTPGRRDLDNCVKVLADAIGDALGLDDRFLTDLYARKRRHTGSETLVTISLLEA